MSSGRVNCQRMELVFRSCTQKQLRLLKWAKTRKFPCWRSPITSAEPFSAAMQKQRVHIYEYLYTCGVGPVTYSLTDLFILCITLFSPPEILNFINLTCVFLFRKLYMCSSRTNYPRRPTAARSLSKTNWNSKVTFLYIYFLNIFFNIFLIY